MFERKKKKKEIIKYALINNSSPGVFIYQLENKVTELLDLGYEVEVQYQLNNSFSALVLAYEVK